MSTITRRSVGFVMNCLANMGAIMSRLGPNSFCANLSRAMVGGVFGQYKPAPCVTETESKQLKRLPYHSYMTSLTVAWQNAH